MEELLTVERILEILKSNVSQQRFEVELTLTRSCYDGNVCFLEKDEEEITSLSLKETVLTSGSL